MRNTFIIFCAFTLLSYSYAQCENSANIYSFNYDGHTYELVRENRTWAAASVCAEMRGGYLAEITSNEENTAIFDELNVNGGITTSNTEAPDGGDGAYVWLGGNDISTEGTWVWENSGTQFWNGDENGSSVGGAYQNWGFDFGGQNEPDDFNSNQDGLGISLNGWPLGSFSQWNDVAVTNTLYYLVEHNEILATKENSIIENNVKLAPNPVLDLVKIESNIPILNVDVVDSSGRSILSFNEIKDNTLNVSKLSQGVYLLKIELQNRTVITKKMIKK